MLENITITIVLFKNNKEQVKKTIICALSSSLVDLIYLIDNSPTQELQSLVFDKRIIYIYNNKNIGFGAAHNTILRQREKLGRYHLVLNPDIYFDGGVLEALGAYLDTNTDVGLITPKVFYPNGDLQYLCKLLPTPLDWIGRLIIPFRSVKNLINYRFELRFSGYNNIMNIPYISGCFMLLRSSVIEELGVFDEGIFMYGEDTDLSRRIHSKYKTIFYPHVYIYHEFHKGSHKNFRLFKIHVRAAVYYFNKWGWFFDRERRHVNCSVLKELNYYGK